MSLDVSRTTREIVDLCGDLEQACLDMDPRKAEDVLYGLMMNARAFRQYLTEGGCLPFPERDVQRRTGHAHGPVKPQVRGDVQPYAARGIQ